MPSPCHMCNDLRKVHEDATRLAFDFAPPELFQPQCPACAMIYEGILKFEDSTWLFNTDISRVYVYGLEKENDSLRLKLYFKDDRPALTREFYRSEQNRITSNDTSWSTNWDAIGQRSKPSDHPMSESGKKWVKARLVTCQEKHRLCNMQSWRNKLPHRTLELQRSSNGKIHVKLMEHTNRSGRYIALSHCWGSTQHYVLQSENMAELKKSIPWGDLPRTFQDAIAVCMELGIHHIWIDTLCIVQDDEHDWELESSRMADIYEHAYLTLAATASKNDSDGCFNHSSTHNVTEYASSPSIAPHLMVRREVQHWEWPPRRATEEYFPLLSRGWAYQERILSPRILHFGKEEMIWVCRSDRTCECGSSLEVQEKKLETDMSHGDAFQNFPVPYPLGNSSGKRHRRRWHRKIDQLKSLSFRHHGFRNQSEDKSNRRLEGNDGFPDSQHERSRGIWQLMFDKVKASSNQHRSFFSKRERAWRPEHSVQISSSAEARHIFESLVHWHKIVQEYSVLHLTRSSDRLPALSGLAVRSSPYLGRYLGGLWSDTLASDLMWRVNALEHGVHGGAASAEPSWTWASVRGPVVYWTESENRIVPGADISRRHSLSELLVRVNKSSFSGTVTTSGANPYGGILSGVLNANAWVQRARLRYVYSRIGVAQHDITGNQELLPLKYELEVLFSKEPFEREMRSVPYMELSFFADYILQEDGPRKIPDNEPLYLLLVHPLVCLVLQALEKGEIPPKFRRIGIVRQPWTFISEYSIDWMYGSRLQSIKVI